MSPEIATGLAVLVVLLAGIFIGYLIGKGKVVIKTRLLEKNVAKAQALLEECSDKTEQKVRELIKKAKKYLE